LLWFLVFHLSFFVVVTPAQMTEQSLANNDVTATSIEGSIILSVTIAGTFAVIITNAIHASQAETLV